MNGLRIAIIGGGPWGTYAVERLAALLTANPPEAPVRVLIFERTGHFGAGATHSDQQVWTSYLNRVASQIAFACDESNTAASALLPLLDRPTFVEWAQERYRATGDARFDLKPQDVPRRQLHGIALREMFDRYVGILRGVPGVEVDLYSSEASDISRGEPKIAPFLVHREDSDAVPVDHVLLVTGHSANTMARDGAETILRKHADENPGAAYIPDVYPLGDKLRERTVPADRSIAVLGMGLTAIDLVLHLTEGRGGSFEPADGDNLRYLASGREPSRIVMAGPSGMFTSSRPENQKAADSSGRGHSALEHKGEFFTAAAIEALRESHGVPAMLSHGEVRQLDFARHLFPLVVLELSYVYYRALLGEDHAKAVRLAVTPRYEEFLRIPGPDSEAAIDHLLAPVDECFVRALDESTLDGTLPEGRVPDIAVHRFRWRRFFDPISSSEAATPEGWRSALIEYMRRDHEAAAQGNLRNPVKAACDGVWRDLRSTFSAALDFGGLTARSHGQFIGLYLRYYNRMSNGTGLVPMRKILALVEAGMVDVSTGPSPVVEPVPGRPVFSVRGPVTSARTEVDTVVAGRAHGFDAERDRRPLYPNLLRRGLVRRWRNPGTTEDAGYEPGGLDVTKDFHPIGADGTAEPRITVLGAPVEGVSFFQLSAARPYSNSSVLNNIAYWATTVVADIPAASGDRHDLEA